MDLSLVFWCKFEASEVVFCNHLSYELILVIVSSLSPVFRSSCKDMISRFLDAS